MKNIVILSKILKEVRNTRTETVSELLKEWKLNEVSKPSDKSVFDFIIQFTRKNATRMMADDSTVLRDALMRKFGVDEKTAESYDSAFTKWWYDGAYPGAFKLTEGNIIEDKQDLTKGELRNMLKKEFPNVPVKLRTISFSGFGYGDGIFVKWDKGDIEINKKMYNFLTDLKSKYSCEGNKIIAESRFDDTVRHSKCHLPYNIISRKNLLVNTKEFDFNEIIERVNYRKSINESKTLCNERRRF